MRRCWCCRPCRSSGRETFAGSPAAINAYFASAPGRITYTPAPNAVASRPLVVKASDGPLSASRTSTIQITPVNDAPVAAAPATFRLTEDVKGNLVWPAAITPFADIDSATLTVTLSVADGTISAAGTPVVAVGGTATARTFQGTAAALNAFFKRIGAIAYTTAANNTASRTLTTSVSDGLLSTSRTSTIQITPVNDAPTVTGPVALAGAVANTPFEITYETLRNASGLADIDGTTPSIAIQAVNSGRVQKWTGTTWVNVSTLASAPVAQRLLAPGQKIRWVPPTGVTGVRAAFQIKAWDGAAFSAVTAQINVLVTA